MAATIQATFGLDINPLKAGFNRASALAASASRAMGTAMISALATPMAAVAVAAGAALSLNALRHGVSNVISAGAELEKLHKQTGISVGSLSTLRGVFAQADVSADGLGASVAKMQRGLFTISAGGGAAAGALRAMGIDAATLMKAKPEVQFATIGKAIAALPSPLARSGAAMAFFGRSGAELLPVFDELKNVNFANLSAKSAIMERDAENFHKITVAFHQARMQLQNVFVGIADGLSPVLLDLGTILASKNALAFGVELGKGLRSASEILVGTFQNPGGTFGAAKEFLIGAGLEFGNVMGNGSHAATVFLHQGVIALNPLFVAVGENFGHVVKAGLYGATALLIDGALDFQALVGATAAYVGERFNFDLQDAARLFSNRWVLAVLSPVAFLSVQLYEVAMSFGKAMSAALKGNLSGVLSQAASLFNVGLQIGNHIAGAIDRGATSTKTDFSTLYKQQRAGLAMTALGGLGAAARSNAATEMALAGAGIGDALKKSSMLLQNAFDELRTADLEKDVYGALAHFKTALALLSGVQQLGRSALAPYATGDPKATAKAALLGRLTDNGGLSGASIALGANAFASRFSAGFIGPLLDPGSASPLLARSGVTSEIGALASKSPWGQTSLLSAGERRGFEDTAVARGETRHASTTAAFAAIRSGDAARRKAEQKQQLAQAVGLDGVNEKLETLIGITKDGLTGEE